MNKMKKELWIDNLKLLACLAVFWGHFYSSFYGQLLDISFLNSVDKVLIFLMQHVFNFFFNGGWWVFTFCLISGWLAWRKEIKTIRMLISQIIHRYIRFVIPVLCANVLVVVIDKTIGYYAFQVGNEINNQWLASNYSAPPQMTHVLKSALLLTNEFVGPLWVLRSIFAGTCIIYCLNYLRFRLKFDNRKTGWMLLSMGGVFGAVFFQYRAIWLYTAVTVGGVFLHLFTLNNESNTERKNVITGIGLILIVLLLDIIQGGTVFNFIFAWLFLWLTFQCTAWRNALEKSRLIGKNGNLSFTVYLLHCPLLYSISMIIYMQLNERGLSYSANFIINWMLSTIIVILASKVYYNLIQKQLDVLVGKLKMVIENSLLKYDMN